MDISSNVDGLFSVTDRTAIGAIKYFKRVGLKIPNDIAVIGFSNLKISGHTSPN